MCDFEKQYLQFINGLYEPPFRESVDYLGINISEQEVAPVFKIYYATRVSPHRKHSLISYLYGRDMLRDFELVKDTVSGTSLRLDMAIKHRNDTNMQAFFQKVRDTTKLFDECEDEVYRLGEMKMTALPSHKYASLYHLGITENNKKITSLKWYFFTKWCENPDYPENNSEYRDSYYLNYFENTQIKEYSFLAGYARQILDSFGGHLWMAAMDVKNAGYRKYKIYIKNTRISYNHLSGLLDNKMKKKLKELEDWKQKHPEFEECGIATCLDTEGYFTINLYYSYV